MSYPGPRRKSHCEPPPNRIRYVVNVPCNTVNPTSTGVRRKMIFEDDPTERQKSYQADQEVENQFVEPYNEDDFEEEPCEESKPVSSLFFNPNFSPKGNLERLKNLIDEESKRVTSSQALARSIGNSLKRPKTFYEASGGIRSDAKMHFDVDSDLETSLPAAMLGAEDQGVPLGQTHPSKFYGRLFPEDKERPTVHVLAASKQKGDKIMPKMTGTWREKQLEYDLDAGIIDFYGMKKAKKPTESPKPAAHEPSDDINELLGISTSEIEGEKEKSYKYVVNREGKHRGNFVQLRGSSNPSWFPGYMHVLPGHNTVQYTEEPYGILDKAWRTLSPSDVDSPHGNYIVGT